MNWRRIPAERMRDLWNSLSREKAFGSISFLQRGAEWDMAEFQLVGSRFADRMCERFVDYGTVQTDAASLLEIGCGVGRFLKPLASRFRSVCGVDVSSEMLSKAAEYCRGIGNVRLVANNRKDLSGFPDCSFDYCVSAGVFQHITDIEIILSYVKEALRVLKPGGVFLFQFEGTRTLRWGWRRVGARITAHDLDRGLAGRSFRIREVSFDPLDAFRCVVVAIQKPGAGGDAAPGSESFVTHRMIERRWLSGVYDDIKTRTMIHRAPARPRRLTFYDARSGSGRPRPPGPSAFKSNSMVYGIRHSIGDATCIYRRCCRNT